MGPAWGPGWGTALGPALGRALVPDWGPALGPGWGPAFGPAFGGNMREVRSILGHIIIFIYLVSTPIFLAIEGFAYYFSNNDIWVLFLAGFVAGLITLNYIWEVVEFMAKIATAKSPVLIINKKSHQEEYEAYKKALKEEQDKEK